MSTLIAPDRRGRHAALLVGASMIAGALLVLFAEHVADSLAQPATPCRLPHVVEHERISGDETMRSRVIFERAARWEHYDPGSRM